MEKEEMMDKQLGNRKLILQISLKVAISSTSVTEELLDIVIFWILKRCT
jgi:hypothetical protein